MADAVLFHSAGESIAVYRCPNKKIDGYAVYTNTVPAGAFRGYGLSQTHFRRRVGDGRAGAQPDIGPVRVSPPQRHPTRRSDADVARLRISRRGIRHLRSRPVPRLAATRRADELASRALAIDPNYAYAHVVKGWVLTTQNRQEEAIVEAERGLALNPSEVEAYMVLADANNLLCRPDRSIEAIDKAIRLSPRDPGLWLLYLIKAEAYFIKRQDANTIEWARRSATLPTDPYSALLLASASALSGQQAEAGEAIKAYLADSRTRSRTISQFQKQQLAMENNPKWLAYNERFAEGLRKAGLPE